MERYEIYRTIKAGDKLIDSLVGVVFSKNDAITTVRSFRKTMGNQMCFYKQSK